MFNNNFFRLFLLFIVTVVSTYGVQVSASSIDWGDLKVESAVYDNSEEELSIMFQIEDISSEPNDDYEITIELDNEDYTKNVRYNNDDEILYAKFKIDIDKEDIEDDYEVDYKIIDEDEEEVYDDDIEFDVETGEDDIDWDDIKVKSAEYEDEELTIIFQIEDISNEPNTDYEMTIELDNDDYSEEFKYDDDDEILYAKFKIDIDKEDIEDDYEVDYKIIDEDEEEVANDDIDFDVEKEEVEIDWDTLSTKSAIYDEDDEKLTIIFQIRSIYEEPEMDYEMNIEFDDDDYTKKFDYNSNYSALFAEFNIFIDEDDIDDEYEIEYEIVDENDDELADDDIDINVGEEDNSLGWEIAVKSAEYDENEQELILECAVENIYNDPNGRYRLIIDLDGKQYTKFLNYRKDEDEMYGKYTISIDSDDIKDDYDMDYIIIDGENEVADDSLEFEVKTIISDDNNENEDGESLSWNKLKIKSGKYDLNTGLLNFSLFIDNVNSKPNGEYTTLMRIDGKRLESDFRYDEETKSFVADFSIDNIDEDDIENVYAIEFEIEDEDGKSELTANGNLKVKTTYIINYITVGDDEDDIRENEISDSLVGAANRVIKRLAKSQKSNTKIADNLEYLVEKLSEIADKKSKYKPIVSDLNYLFEKAIKEYKNY